MGSQLTVLVTGGAGYIGSIAVNELIDQNYRVIVLDNLQNGHREAVRPEAKFIEGDLADSDRVNDIFVKDQVDAIMHFASNTLPGESMEQPFKYLGENVINAINLIERATKHGVSRFILSSTANLFDQPENIPISEEERIIPGSPYGESKFLIERLLYWADKIYGMKYVCLRYFNAAGAHPSGLIGEDHDPEYHLIPIIMQVALGQREHIVIFGEDYPTPDGTCIRDYIHVVDLVQAHLLALKSLEHNPSRAYNLGNGVGYSVRQVIEMARKITGHSIPSQIGPRRPGDPSELIAASDQAKTKLGWAPEYSDLSTILKTAWEWHRHHPRGYKTT